MKTKGKAKKILHSKCKTNLGLTGYNLPEKKSQKQEFSLHCWDDPDAADADGADDVDAGGEGLGGPDC